MEEEPSVEKEGEEPTELPEITEQMEVVIRNTERSRNQVLVEAFKIQITGKDIRTLRGLNWLDDEVINFYMQVMNDEFHDIDDCDTSFNSLLSELGFLEH